MCTISATCFMLKFYGQAFGITLVIGAVVAQGGGGGGGGDHHHHHHDHHYEHHHHQFLHNKHEKKVDIHVSC